MTPVPIAGVGVRSGFDPNRVHPLTGKVKAHTGADLAVPVGTPVHPVLDGVVYAGGYDPPSKEGGTGAGYFLKLKHGAIGGQQITSRYYHLSARFVGPGDDVTVDDVIAASGNTGDSTGPHLHFEIRVDGVPVDPIAWLAAHEGAPRQHTPPPTASEEDTMRGYAIRNHNGAIGLVSPDGTLEPIPSMGIYDSMKRCGFIEGDPGWHQENDGTVWNALTAHTAQVRARDAGTDAAALTAKLAALIVPAVVDALDDIPTDAVEAAVERAIRGVLGALDDTPTA